MAVRLTVGLKQRPASAGEGEGGAAQPNGVEITEANLESRVLVRSSQVPVSCSVVRRSRPARNSATSSPNSRPPTAASGRWRR